MAAISSSPAAWFFGKAERPVLNSFTADLKHALRAFDGTRQTEFLATASADQEAVATPKPLANTVPVQAASKPAQRTANPPSKTNQRENLPAPLQPSTVPIQVAPETSPPPLPTASSNVHPKLAPATRSSTGLQPLGGYVPGSGLRVALTHGQMAPLETHPSSSAVPPSAGQPGAQNLDGVQGPQPVALACAQTTDPTPQAVENEWTSIACASNEAVASAIAQAGLPSATVRSSSESPALTRFIAPATPPVNDQWLHTIKQPLAATNCEHGSTQPLQQAAQSPAAQPNVAFSLKLVEPVSLSKTFHPEPTTTLAARSSVPTLGVGAEIPNSRASGAALKQEQPTSSPEKTTQVSSQGSTAHPTQGATCAVEVNAQSPWLNEQNGSTPMASQNASVANPLAVSSSGSSVAKPTNPPAASDNPAPARDAQSLTTITNGVQSAHLVQSACQSEMRVGLRTQDFGGIELRTTLRDSVVGLAIANEKGDLRSFLALEMPAIQTGLRQQELRFEPVRFLGANFGTNAGSSGQPDSQPRWSAPQQSTSSMGVAEGDYIQPSQQESETPPARRDGLSVHA